MELTKLTLTQMLAIMAVDPSTKKTERKKVRKRIRMKICGRKMLEQCIEILAKVIQVAAVRLYLTDKLVQGAQTEISRTLQSGRQKDNF